MTSKEEKRLRVFVLLSFVCIGVGSRLSFGQQLSLCCGKRRRLRLMIGERYTKRVFPTLSYPFSFACLSFLGGSGYSLGLALMFFGASICHSLKLYGCRF
jgi:hypothetical protein